MLVYILAIAIALASFALFLTAFIKPILYLHKKDDFLWSGVGLFYALVLWDCAGTITGGVLLGQTASVLLLGWFGWQTILYRQAIAFPDQQETILKFSLLEWLESKIKAKKPVVSAQKKAPVKEETAPDKVEPVTEPVEKTVITKPETIETQEEIISPENSPKTPEIKPEIETKEEIKAEIEPEKKGFSFGKIFGGKKTDKKETVKTESITEIWEEEPLIEETKTVAVPEPKEETKILESQKNEEEIKETEIVQPEQSGENIANLEEKKDENQAKPENKIKEINEDENPFKDLTS
jgi:Ycf66 protein N-terminus